ncbi:peptide deformylase [Paenibacillus thalictri]|uniref:Peptide deformylase n=1 Tax=Paenibacillus thalictri TaxID=2527873 RepID=A0A4Q9DQJ6_9BACL|nr:peptide deformylase [Paenibacillus thalictri]TBL77261.1 peptide deformylase [Paenibacillus thalictri]
MTVRQILPFGDSILRKQAKRVDDITPKITRLLDDMAETLYASDGRAGLAAPQVGVLRQLIVMDCGDGLIEFINPQILEMSGKQTGAEACLSFPGFAGEVERANVVKISSQNRKGETFILEGEGFLARCIQHEVDHLNGVLFVDHMKSKWLFHEKTNERISLHEVVRLSRQNG